jgi:hypothetical protein
MTIFHENIQFMLLTPFANLGKTLSQSRQPLEHVALHDGLVDELLKGEALNTALGLSLMARESHG